MTSPPTNHEPADGSFLVMTSPLTNREPVLRLFYANQPMVTEQERDRRRKKKKKEKRTEKKKKTPAARHRMEADQSESAISLVKPNRIRSNGRTSMANKIRYK